MQNNNRNSIIVLIGFMGSGKTTIGKKLAEMLNYEFVDSDDEIEKNEKMSISEIFKTKGENYFRKLESNFIQAFRHEKCILATGGGLACHNDNIESLKKMGLVIYLKTPFELIVDRIKKSGSIRPKAMLDSNLTTDDSLLKLYNDREKVYNQANIEIDGSQNLDKSVIEIISLLSS